jgi:hypothetical protein
MCIFEGRSLLIEAIEGTGQTKSEPFRWLPYFTDVSGRVIRKSGLFPAAGNKMFELARVQSGAAGSPP